ncbi:MAG: calcium/sodium antiporter [Gammaproteobacteria bacterium]
MWLFSTALVSGLALLIFSADRFVAGTASIARGMGVSPLTIGLTIVGLGTSAPEILVSAISSWTGNAGLAVGNAVGSNIANIGLILGVTALVAPVAVHSKILRRELPVLLLTSVACYLLGFDGLGMTDAIILFSGLVVFLWWLVRSALSDRNNDALNTDLEQEFAVSLPLGKSSFFMGMGLLGLLLSSRLVVWSAVNIASSCGVSDLVIGLTIVALGTSLPELATSVMSVLKKENDLAVGNIIGSNMFNLLTVYSLPGLIAPGRLADSVISRDFPVMLAFTGIIFVSGYGFVAKEGSIGRLEGLGLLLFYCGYQWFVMQDGAVSG